MNSPIIKCISLSKYYTSRDQTTKAVDDVNLEINKNEIVLLKGRTGAGKSTLINLMCGLDRPTSGDVIVENEYINKLSDQGLSRVLLKKIGIIFQNFNLLPTYTVYENIEIALEPTANDRGENERIIVPLLEQLELLDKVNSLPYELSIGQQQKVAIARILAKQPSIIFADEPTGSVDEETAKEIIHHLLFLKNERNVTLVVTTHGSAFDKSAERIIIMGSGKIINYVC
jgi:putative ABC transport system ATP-binding protein